MDNRNVPLEMAWDDIIAAPDDIIAAFKGSLPITRKSRGSAALVTMTGELQA
jgi:hypothetical protein